MLRAHLMPHAHLMLCAHQILQSHQIPYLNINMKFFPRNYKVYKNLLFSIVNYLFCFFNLVDAHILQTQHITTPKECKRNYMHHNIQHDLSI